MISSSYQHPLVTQTIAHMQRPVRSFLKDLQFKLAFTDDLPISYEESDGAREVRSTWTFEYGNQKHLIFTAAFQYYSGADPWVYLMLRYTDRARSGFTYSDLTTTSGEAPLNRVIKMLEETMINGLDEFAQRIWLRTVVEGSEELSAKYLDDAVDILSKKREAFRQLNKKA